MTTIANNADQRARMFQLQALGFTHPVYEFHQRLADNGYAAALTQCCTAATGIASELPPAQPAFAQFEADYIHLFQLGRGGKPVVALTAGDHELLSDGQGRPEFMLQYTAWYKHFGLKINETDDANELPDHLICQLEFMAWLSHLEYTSRHDRTLQRGYQRAQRDFLQRHLQPFLALLAHSLQQAANPPHRSPFHCALAALTLDTSTALLSGLEKALPGDSQAQSSGATQQIAAVNLWG